MHIDEDTHHPNKVWKECTSRKRAPIKVCPLQSPGSTAQDKALNNNASKPDTIKMPNLETPGNQSRKNKPAGHVSLSSLPTMSIN
jgi:hypothetical protein